MGNPNQHIKLPPASILKGSTIIWYSHPTGGADEARIVRVEITPDVPEWIRYGNDRDNGGRFWAHPPGDRWNRPLRWFTFHLDTGQSYSIREDGEILIPFRLRDDD